ncbi:MAG: endopeptidase La [Planctomycetes bacterium]|nr:endopeptidase La [Planctomycetota bacterium]
MTKSVSSASSPRSAMQFPDVLPVLPLRDTVVLPTAFAPLAVGQERSVRLIDAVVATDSRLMVLVRQRDGATQPAGSADCAKVGVLAVIRQIHRPDGAPAQLLVQGLERVRIESFASDDPFVTARIVPAPDPADTSVETEGLAASVRELFAKLVASSDELPDILAAAVLQVTDPAQTSWVIGAHVQMDSAARQELLEMDSVAARLRSLAARIQHELAVRDVSRKIESATQETLTKAQREYVLREQLRTIRAELGDDETDEAAADDLGERLAKIALPPEAKKEVDRELARLRRVPSSSPEHGVIRSYLEWVSELPWAATADLPIDVETARAVLDEDHHGLDEVKDRILESLAVRKLRRERGAENDATGGTTAVADIGREPILCLVGPPGVGKTSLAHSIASALGRKCLRISLGGVHDESEIRGHRRTYIGAMPGRIIQALRRAETSDPVFILDEVDKLGRGVQGDPASALLELLDPAQNHAFTDSYLGVPFDLSRAMFVCTANSIDTIPWPLFDRMEVLSIAGYTEAEKLVIAKRFIVPRQTKASGLRPAELSITDDALRTVIRQHTRESGVRSLERRIATICRKAALAVANGQGPAVITDANLADSLGPPKSPLDSAERVDRPGVVTGLAWTPSGGDILFVEATATPARSGRLLITGSLGEVMRESAQAALTWVRAHPDITGVAAETLDEREIHVHVPGGATPKDGPSAGVAIATALASALSGRVVRSDVAMTGEITLRGKVLPVGGIKEKVLAAHRAGITTVLVPRWNMQDLDEIPDDVRAALRFIPVDTAEEALAAALLPVPVPNLRAA